MWFIKMARCCKMSDGTWEIFFFACHIHPAGLEKVTEEWLDHGVVSAKSRLAVQMFWAAAIDVYAKKKKKA